jgi:Ca2+-binding EF-hand superfamily protein
MGNKQAKDAGDSMHVFTQLEESLLLKMYESLAASSPGTTIDKSMFLRFFPLPGLFGERLFSLFDTKHHNCIDYEEFAACCSHVASTGDTTEAKMQFFYQLFDLNGDHCISRGELEALMRHVPIEVVVVPENAENLDVFDQLSAVCDQELPDPDAVMTFDSFQAFMNRQPAMRECVLPACVGGLSVWKDGRKRGRAHGREASEDGEVLYEVWRGEWRGCRLGRHCCSRLRAGTARERPRVSCAVV